MQEAECAYRDVYDPEGRQREHDCAALPAVPEETEGRREESEADER